MSGEAVLRAAIAAADAAALLAVRGASEALAARAAAVPGVAAETGDSAVRLRGRGLLVRAFGSRRRAADPALAALLAGDKA